MHEVHAMAQVVRLAQETVKNAGGRPTLVRLRVAAGSHLAALDACRLQDAFAVAARGTALEGAAVETTVVPSGALCLSCDRNFETETKEPRCPACGSHEALVDFHDNLFLDEILVDE